LFFDGVVYCSDGGPHYQTSDIGQTVDDIWAEYTWDNGRSEDSLREVIDLSLSSLAKVTIPYCRSHLLPRLYIEYGSIAHRNKFEDAFRRCASGIAGVALGDRAQFRFICNWLESYFCIDSPEQLTNPMFNSHCGEICTLLEAVKIFNQSLQRGDPEKKKSARFYRRALAKIKELCENPQ
jgi:hypothetical protein